MVEDITVKVGMGMSSGFYTWISEFFSRKITRKNGAEIRRLLVNFSPDPIAFEVSREWRTLVSSGHSTSTHIGAWSALVLTPS